MTTVMCDASMCKYRGDEGRCYLERITCDECGGCRQFAARYTCGDCIRHMTEGCFWYKLIRRHPESSDHADGSCFQLRKDRSDG